MKDFQIESTAEQAVAKELSAGERLLWSGKPRQGVFLQRHDAIAIPFSALWFGGVCVFELQALKSGNLFTILWGVPFILVGVYIFFVRFFWDERVRRNTYYGLTDRRAIIVQRGFRGNVKSVAYAGMHEISFSDGPGDRGTITFGPETPLWGWSNDGRSPRSPQFLQIRNGRDVYGRILRLQGDASQTAQGESARMFRF